MPKFGYFVPKNINYLIFQRIYLYPTLKVLISNLTLVFENFDPKYRNVSIYAKKYQLPNLNEILPVPCFQGADSKSGICFQKFGPQIPEFRHFGLENINFLNLVPSASFRYKRKAKKRPWNTSNT